MVPLTWVLETTDAAPETSQTGRIPEGFQTILVIWSPGPLWSPVKLWNVHFACTPEGYRKDTGRIPEGCQNPVKGVTESHCNFTRTPEEYRKDTGRIPEGNSK